jgi:iron(III) transport system substrate-binding protein
LNGNRRMRGTRAVWLVCVMCLCALGSGCRDSSGAKSQADVTLYCSVDEEFGRQVVEAYSKQTGATVSVLFDQEATKTTGLVNKIKSESGGPRADVFWSGEIFNTILLGKAGFLQAYRSPAAQDIPDGLKDPEGYWTGIGLRARVIAFNPKKIRKAEVPTRWADLANDRWSRQVAMANPIAGTTRGHVGAMFVLWGREEATGFLRKLDEREIRIADGNSAAVRLVARGDVLLCATDTDDVWVAQRRGEDVDLVYPDMGDGGTLLIPCTVALLAGAKHAAEGRKLIDFLVSAEVERMLAKSESRNVPVRARLREELGMSLPPGSKVGYGATADVMDQAIDVAREILLR